MVSHSDYSVERTPFEIFAWELALDDRRRELEGQSRVSRALRRTVARTAFSWQNRIRPRVETLVNELEITAEGVFAAAVNRIQDTREAVSTQKNIVDLKVAIDKHFPGSPDRSDHYLRLVINNVYGEQIRPNQPQPDGEHQNNTSGRKTV